MDKKNNSDERLEQNAQESSSQHQPAADSKDTASDSAHPVETTLDAAFGQQASSGNEQTEEARHDEGQPETVINHEEDTDSANGEEEALPAGAAAEEEGQAASSYSGRRGMIWTVSTLVVIAAAVAAFIWLKPSDAKATDKLAVVNGTVISKETVANRMYDQTPKESIDQLVDQMVTEELIKQAADKKNVKVSDAAVNKELDKIKNGFHSEDEFTSALQQSSMSVETLKDQIRMNEMMKGILKGEITIKDADAKKYYDEHKAEFADPEQVKASHILVKTKEEADKIEKELKAGGDFAELAKKYSTDGSKDQGGDLGYFKKEDMVKEFSDVAFKLPVGQISEPVKSEFGYHIIKVTDKKPGKEYTYEEKKQDVKDQLFDQQMQTKAPEWLDQQKKAAKIERS